jgi:hypothetical protein
MDEAAQRAYAAGLFARLDEAVDLIRTQVSIGDWSPVNGRCHENARTWVERNPHHKHVFGWHCADYSETGFFRFYAHSVIEDEEGKLHDITPNSRPARRFLRDRSSHEEHERMVEVHRIVAIDHVLFDSPLRSILSW